MKEMIIFFWIMSFIVIYSYFGYGIVVYIINKFKFIKQLIPLPENHINSSYVDQNYEPKVSLIISATGEDEELIREKIENSLKLNYPQDKLEIIFALAYNNNKYDPTLSEYYNTFLEDLKFQFTSLQEEIFSKFYRFKFINQNSKILFLDDISKELNCFQFTSKDMKGLGKEMITGADLILNENINIKITKDIERKGKISQLNRTIKQASGEIIIFSDANAMYNENSIKEIVKHFKDFAVGAVAGEKRIKKQQSSTSAESEGLYWKYESFLKRMDSELWSAVGAAGEIFAVRKNLVEDGINKEAIIEDFVTSMLIAMKGYRVIYEPNAYSEETPTHDLKSEYIRKRRIIAGGFQSIIWLRKLLNPFRYKVLSFQFISHRLLRWAVVPFLLPIIFAINLILAKDKNTFYTITLLIQVVIYLLSIIGIILEKYRIRNKIFNIPLYFTMMNYAAYTGLIRFISGKQSVVWEKVNR